MNKLTSIKTQLPYEYYSIPYCKPEVVKSSAENLGEVLRGDRIENSLYEVCLALPDSGPARSQSGTATDVYAAQIFIRVDQQCRIVCRIPDLNAAQAKSFRSKIEEEYRVMM